MMLEFIQPLSMALKADGTKENRIDVLSSMRRPILTYGTKSMYNLACDSPLRRGDNTLCVKIMHAHMCSPISVDINMTLTLSCQSNKSSICCKLPYTLSMWWVFDIHPLLSFHCIYVFHIFLFGDDHMMLPQHLTRVRELEEMIKLSTSQGSWEEWDVIGYI